MEKTIITEYNHAIFKYSEEDSSLIKELNDYIDENIEEIYDFFELKNRKDKAIIEIMPTKDAIDIAVSKAKEVDVSSIPNWLIGFSCSDKIYFLSLRDYKSTPYKDKTDLEEYKKTILHEYIHYIVGLFSIENKCDYPHKALNEGIAQYLSHQRDRNIIELKHDLSEVLDGTRAYSEWYLITKYILDNYSKDYFLELLKDKNKTRKFITDNFDNIKNMKQVKR